VWGYQADGGDGYRLVDRAPAATSDLSGPSDAGAREGGLVALQRVAEAA
jgi:hypothetical protein